MIRARALPPLSRVDLRCKVLRASTPQELELSINEFLADLDEEGEAEIADITQSEGPAGITVSIWYTLLEEQDDEVIARDADTHLHAVPDREPYT